MTPTKEQLLEVWEREQERKAKKRAYMRAYYQRPDIKAKRRAYYMEKISSKNRTKRAMSIKRRYQNDPRPSEE